MKLKLPATAFAAGILCLADITSAAPFWTDLFNLQPLGICTPPPTPKAYRIDAATLSKIVKPFMPPFKNGLGSLTSFRPKYINFTRKSDTFLFQDPHIKAFQAIAPNSTQLFLRRELVNSTRMSYPYSTMGKVFLRDGAKRGSCSGTAVGPNLMLTANHCVSWNSTGDWSLEFVPGFNAEDARLPRPWGSAFAKQCLGIDPALIDGRDYAICELDSSIGLTVGYLGWRASTKNDFYLGGTWSSVGYPFNFRNGAVPATEENIKIRKIQNSGGESGKLMATSPYVEQGWSGGPLFGWEGDEPFVAGVVSANVGTSAFDHIFAEFTFHAGGVRLAEMVQYGLSQWKS